MHLHWEKNPSSAGDCNIRSLSWMGRVPDEIPQDEGWKLNRSHYYQEGWLSTANLRGVVGVTYTTSHCGNGGNGGGGFGGNGSSGVAGPDDAAAHGPSRTNYNLRGHRSEVTLVRWNEPYQKLASCDTSGIIFVWIKYEGRWSIELINDRNTPVICFSWSHDGRMALICYQDGFVLVGSVAGQRYWSTLLPMDIYTITCGTWTPDDQQVYLGTAQGGILVMDILGNTVGRVSVREGVAITDLAWNCERFSMEEQPTTTAEQQQQQEAQSCRANGKPFILATCLKNGEILLMRTFDDFIPQVIDTGFQNYLVDWTNSGDVLAVAGKIREKTSREDHTFRYESAVKFFGDMGGTLLYTAKIPSDKSPVTSMTWGHNDKRLFVATGNQIHVGWVSPNIASLQLLSRLRIHKTLREQHQVQLLPLPCRIQNLIGMLFTNTIRSCVPQPSQLRDFVTRSHPANFRLHCTMIRHSDGNEGGSGSGNGNGSGGGGEGSCGVGTAYTLYLEHLGGFLPMLKGKKTSKLRPEFVIFDPTMSEDQTSQWLHLPSSHSARRGVVPMDLSESDQAELDSETASAEQSPRARRRRRTQGRRRAGGMRYGMVDSHDYVNVLPEEARLAEVTSNFWGTKFQIISHNLELLPADLGEVIYKASLLHLQPRQMRLELPDLRDRCCNADPFATDDEDEDEDAENDLSDDEEFFKMEQGVLMRDDILRAVSAAAANRGSSGYNSSNNPLDVSSSDSSAAELCNGSSVNPSHHVAPIAPLPTRLSFCLPSGSSRINTPCSPKQLLLNGNTNESSICEALESVMEEAKDIVDRTQQGRPSPLRIKSPVKTVMFAKPDGGGVMLAGVHVQEGQVLSPLRMKPSLMETSTTSMTAEASSFSPQTRRKMRLSVSCDNYLGESSKFSLSRRDSVGSGSPHSSRGSPRRWAAKVDELVEEAEGERRGDPDRSSSSNELDVIVDLLGVPSDLLTQRDVINKRLFLLSESKKMRSKEVTKRTPPSLEQCGKSWSCDDDGGKVAAAATSVRRRTKRSDQRTDRDYEKRRSVYSHNCRGRSESKTCENCETIAKEINDSDLNREIFDMPNLEGNNEDEGGEREEAEDVVEKEEEEAEESCVEKKVLRMLPDVDSIVCERPTHPPLLPPIRENIPTSLSVKDDAAVRISSRNETSVTTLPSSTSPRPPRRFDSVRNLLEKARNILLSSSAKARRNKSQQRCGEAEEDSHNPRPILHPRMQQQQRHRPRREQLGNGEASFAQTQSSPNTPLSMRKAKNRNRSFSPVRALLNSPLLRRKKLPAESSEEDLTCPNDDADSNTLAGQQQPVANASSVGYRDLETFQKQQLRQKLRKLNDNHVPPSACSSSSAPAGSSSAISLLLPTNTPSPTPPTQFLSPFLPRRNFLPSCSPNLSLLSRARGCSSKVSGILTAPPPIRARYNRNRRKRLVLRNKSPMWNETSQVYQLDFGGRVTQESAKNFQIEYKDKQVMQFGRIDNNAYTLDFQYPFTAIQAFGVALANVTQRLK